MRHKNSIGEVGFGKPCPLVENSGGWKHVDVYGKERVELLHLAMRGEPLPDGLFLTGQVPGGVEPITRDDVDWLTSGLEEK